MNNDIAYSPAKGRRKTGPRLIRLAHPMAFGKLIERIGASRIRLFQLAGLPALYEDPNAFVPVERAWKAFDLASQYQDREFGWHVGQFVAEYNLNARILRRIDSAPTLYAGLHALIRLISCEASDLELGIVEREQDILFFTHYPNNKKIPGYTSSQAYQLSIYLSVIRHFLGPDWGPDEIGIESKWTPKTASDISLGARIRTGAPYGYIRIPRQLLMEEARCRLDVVDNTGIQRTKYFSYVDRLRAILVPYLSEGYPSSKLAAELIGTSQRTLARRLSDEGITYGDLIDEIRFNTAKTLLRDTTKSIHQIAGSVGFSDQSHFTRMFRRIGGVTPSAYRLSGEKNLFRPAGKKGNAFDGPPASASRPK